MLISVLLMVLYKMQRWQTTDTSTTRNSSVNAIRLAFDDRRPQNRTGHAYVLTTWCSCGPRSSCGGAWRQLLDPPSVSGCRRGPEMIKLWLHRVVWQCTRGSGEGTGPKVRCSPKLLILSLSFWLWRWTIGPLQSACMRAVARFRLCCLAKHNGIAHPHVSLGSPA